MAKSRNDCSHKLTIIHIIFEINNIFKIAKKYITMQL